MRVMIALLSKHPMTKDKPIYHVWNVNRWKCLGKTSIFHRFTNPRRNKSVDFWLWGTYLLIYICNNIQRCPDASHTNTVDLTILKV